MVASISYQIIFVVLTLYICFKLSTVEPWLVIKLEVKKPDSNTTEVM
jgi:hypothetical protein